LSAAYLELEITESTIMQKDGVTDTTFRELHEMGIALTLDDFGNGYSLLSYLRRFPIGRVKIDRSFVAQLQTDPSDAALAKAIIAMAHSLRLNVVAEGVETLEQVELLRKLGCDDLQGYIFSPAVPAAEFLRFLEQEKRE
jgi:EAL domain-containing protein (putative c-di-GMP-specific phosphodiesterase class I)